MYNLQRQTAGKMATTSTWTWCGLPDPSCLSFQQGRWLLASLIALYSPAALGFNIDMGATVTEEFLYTGGPDGSSEFEPERSTSATFRLGAYDLTELDPRGWADRVDLGYLYFEYSQGSADRQRVDGDDLDVGTSADYSRLTVGATGKYHLYKLPEIISISGIYGAEFSYIDTEGDVYHTQEYGATEEGNLTDACENADTAIAVQENCPYHSFDHSGFAEGLIIGLEAMISFTDNLHAMGQWTYSASVLDDDDYFYTVAREELTYGLFYRLEM
ncbi:hypothetical protein [Halorhodospira halochloris]|uniref:hypothetical protein n=1 Tax=Halorhodospira halochloris TaxID=1052 RepID=UPI001EE8121E|nr:hypothetical protein [Halorhodospira halochloris]MCG5547982.1 hypothetical protein [Halorhodospira halochloris]